MSGSITSRDTQTVQLNSDYKLVKVYVETGDTVKRGDPLLEYDMTLTELQREMENLTKQSLEIDLASQQKALEKLQNTTPTASLEVNDGVMTASDELLLEEDPAAGGQGSGGNYMYDWRSVPHMEDLGFPIAELTEDTFEITKTPGSGGIICEQSCKEQFLYEVLDPANYITPDVNVDISKATITQAGPDRVRIGNIHGKKKPDTLKLCVGYHKGWKTVSMLSFAWPDAYEKAKYCGEIIMKKMKKRGMKADDVHISYIGLNSLHLGVADMSEEALKNLNECVLRIAVFSEDKNECAKIIPEISTMQLNGPPGASFFGGRAHVQEVMALWPTTVPRDALDIQSHILEV